MLWSDSLHSAGRPGRLLNVLSLDVRGQNVPELTIVCSIQAGGPDLQSLWLRGRIRSHHASRNADVDRFEERRADEVHRLAIDREKAEETPKKPGLHRSGIGVL